MNRGIRGLPHRPDKLVQVSTFITGAVATGTTQIPYDDTIPTSTEGDQYMQLAHTPLSELNLLLFEIFGHFSHSATNRIALALFKDADTAARAVSYDDAVTFDMTCKYDLEWAMVAGSRAPALWKVRAGSPTAGTTTFNGVSTARRFGGALSSGIIIREYAP